MVLGVGLVPSSELMCTGEIDSNRYNSRQMMTPYRHFYQLYSWWMKKGSRSRKFTFGSLQWHFPE